MSHNNNSLQRATMVPSHSRRRLNPDDPAEMSSVRGDQSRSHPLEFRCVPVPILFQPVSLSQGEWRFRPIFPTSSASLPSSHLVPQRLSSSNNSPSFHSSSNLETRRTSSSNISTRFQASTHLVPQRASSSNTGATLQPPNNLVAQSTYYINNGSIFQPSSNAGLQRSSSGNTNGIFQPSSHLEPQRTSPISLLLKRDFASAFEGLDMSFQQSLERAMDPQNGSWFPDIPMDARDRFLMQLSPEDVEYQSRLLALRARWSYDAVVTSKARAKEAEKQNHALRNQLGTIQAFLEEEKRTREQADHAREAASKRVKEVEAELAAAERNVELWHAEMTHLVQANTRLQSNLDEAYGEGAAERIKELEEQIDTLIQELEERRADVDSSTKDDTRLQANTNEDAEHLFREYDNNVET